MRHLLRAGRIALELVCILGLLAVFPLVVIAAIPWLVLTRDRFQKSHDRPRGPGPPGAYQMHDVYERRD